MRKKQIEGFPHLELYDNGTILNTKTGRRMKGSVRKDGYVRFHLKSNGLDTTPMAHMLVAKYFVPNPNNYTYVIHKDGDLSNNCADNLEWVKLPPGLENVTKKTPKRGKTYQKSQEETEEKWRRIGEHPTYLISSFGRVMNTKTKKLLQPSQEKGYNTIKINGNFYAIHNLVYVAFTGDSDLNGYVIKHKNGNNFNDKLFNLEKVPRSEIYKKTAPNKRPVICYDGFHDRVGEFESVTQCGREMGLDPSMISKVCRGIYKQYYGYTFKYKLDLQRLV